MENEDSGGKAWELQPGEYFVNKAGEPYDISNLNIYQRIREIKREVSGIDKRGKHAQGFAFARHDDVTAALSGLFVKWGVDREVSVIDAQRNGGIIGLRVQVSWVNVDSPQDRKTIEVYAEGIDVTKRDGNLNTDGLAAGKGLSYAVKMAELKNFCLVGDTTPDSESRHLSEPAVETPSDTDFEGLKKLYQDANTPELFRAAREKMVPYTTQKKFTPAQVAELSILDKEAKQRCG
jgi:hypothetical protein